MAYREPSPPTLAPTRLGYGPFAFRGPRLALGIALVAVGAFVAADRFETQLVQCRAGSGCEITTDAFARQRHVSTGPLTAVSIETIPCGVQPHFDRRCGVLVLQDRTQSYRLIPIAEGQARNASVGLRRELAPSSTDSLALRLQKPSRHIMTAAVGQLLFGLGLIAFALAGLSRYHILVDGDRRRLTLRSTLFGLPVGTRHLDVGEVRDARVEWRADGGILVLDTDRGELRLDDKPRRGWDVLRRAEYALRQAFDCPPRSPEAQSRIERADKEHRPPSRTPGLARRLLVGLAGGALLAQVDMLAVDVLPPSGRFWAVVTLAGALVGAYAAVEARTRI